MKISVGGYRLKVTDPITRCAIPVLILYPTLCVPQPVQFGPYTLDLAMNAPIISDSLPLVLISHGTGSSYLMFRDLAHFLAKNHLMVALLDHPGDNLFDKHLQYTYQNMVDRPRHLSAVIDVICAHDLFQSHVQENHVTVIGHSVGGYTALAMGGGKPHTEFLVQFCENSEDSAAAPWIAMIRKNKLPSQAVAVRADHRVKNLVLLAPDVSLFMKANALNEIKAPTLLMVAQNDLWPEKIIDIVSKGYNPGCILETKFIKNAGHYAFISPFPDTMKTKVGEAAIDPPGFDRHAFQTQLQTDILNFISKPQFLST